MQPVLPLTDFETLGRDKRAYVVVEVLRARGTATEDEVKADLVERYALTVEHQTAQLASGANRLDHLLSLTWQDLQAVGAVRESAGPARALTEFGQNVSNEALRDVCTKQRREHREQVARDSDNTMALRGLLVICDTRRAADRKQQWFAKRLTLAGYSVDVEPAVNTFVCADGTVMEETSFMVVTDLRCTAKEQRDLIRSLDERLSLAAKREQEAQDRLAQRRQRRQELRPFFAKVVGFTLLAALMLFSLISLRNEEPGSPLPPGFVPERDICFGPWGTEDC